MDRNTSKSKIWDSKILWAVVSIIASVLLWVYVTTTEGDIIRETYEGVAVVFKGEETLRDRDGLVITNPSSNTVSVTLSGTRRDISRLSADQLTAEVDVSKVVSSGPHTYTYTVGYPVGTSASAFTVISTSPQTISFDVDRTNSKTIEVRGEFNGSVAEGYANNPLTFEPETVSISGPQNEIEKVAYAWVVVDRQDVDRTLSFENDYILMDSEGNEVPLGNIVKERETVTVTLTVTMSKEVPLTVDLTNGAGASSENTTIVCDPVNITITGDAETLDGINKISVGTVDLTSFETTFEKTFPIVLPDNVTNVTGLTEAKVTVQVIGLETKKLNATNISVINLTSGYTSDIVTESVIVTLRGAPDMLDKVQANNIRLVVDLAEQGSATGTFEVDAKVYVDGFTDVGAVGQYKVFVKIS